MGDVVDDVEVVDGFGNLIGRRHRLALGEMVMLRDALKQLSTLPLILVTPYGIYTLSTSIFSMIRMSLAEGSDSPGNLSSLQNTWCSWTT